MTKLRDRWLRTLRYQVPVADVHAARETFRRGDLDGAIPVMRDALDQFHQAGRLSYVVWATDVLVESLLTRGTDDDMGEAHRAMAAHLGFEGHLAWADATT